MYVIESGYIMVRNRKKNGAENCQTCIGRCKKQCAQEHYFEAQNLIERKMLGQYNESYMPLGSFRYHYYGIENVENYRRELDLEEAVVRTEFTCAGRQYQSEVFVSNPDHAMVVHLVSETKNED